MIVLAINESRHRQSVGSVSKPCSGAVPGVLYSHVLEQEKQQGGVEECDIVYIDLPSYKQVEI